MTLGLCPWRRGGGAEWSGGAGSHAVRVRELQGGRAAVCCLPTAGSDFLSLSSAPHPRDGGEQEGPIRLNCIGGAVCSHGD